MAKVTSKETVVSYNLELTSEEAELLLRMLNTVGGNSDSNGRKLSENIRVHLSRVLNLSTCSLSGKYPARGSITFE